MHPVRTLLITWLMLPSAALAWGPMGHEIICEIAWQESSQSVRGEITKLLQGDRYRTFPRACYWADRVLRNDSYAWSAPHHYLNVDVASDDIDLARDCPVTGRGCVLRAIDINQAILTDDAEPFARRREALKFLGHFVGDVHQPLHVSHRRDRGGNTIAVTFFGKSSNLHRVWDSGLISRAERIDAHTLATRIRSHISEANRKAWISDTPRDWGEESYDLARTVAYRSPPEGWIIADAYFEAHYRLVHERLARAGIRLAGILAVTFGEE
jgi:hypothetical protein